MAWRDCSPYTICFAIDLVSYFFFAFVGSPPSMTAKTSSSRMMRNSSPSSLISCPEYFPNRMRSPAFTSSGTRLPSSFDLPAPAAITLPCWGFSLAESGMMIPPTFCSPSSIRETMMRSCNGLTFMLCTPSVVGLGLSVGLALDTCDCQLYGGHWQCQVGTASFGGLWALDLVLAHLARERVAVHPESAGGFREAAVAPAEHAGDE